MNIQLTINQLFRYGYGGFLLLIVAYVVHPTWTQRMIDDLGPVLSTLVAIAIGATIYVLYRVLIDEPLLTRAHKAAHSGRTASSCKHHFLRDLGVEEAATLDAYRLIRDRFFGQRQKDWFELQHSENHLLGLTAFLFAASLVGASGNLISQSGITPDAVGRMVLFGGIALLTFACAVKLDINICRRERAYLGTFDSNRVKDLLVQGGFIRNEET